MPVGGGIVEFTLLSVLFALFLIVWFVGRRTGSFSLLTCAVNGNNNRQINGKKRDFWLVSS